MAYFQKVTYKCGHWRSHMVKTREAAGNRAPNKLCEMCAKRKSVDERKQKLIDDERARMLLDEVDKPRSEL